MLLALETSCDETAAAVLAGVGDLRASVIASQAELHNRYGGVVPEVASRSHLEAVSAVVAQALAEANVSLDEIEGFAATFGPGLAPALLIGLSHAKGLAIARRKPFYAINHMEGHLLSPFFGRAEIPQSIGLVVSGGHTLLIRIDGFRQYTLLGQTLDDAAGEAFDKVAKLLGLPYPGGLEIDRLAEQGDPKRYEFPRSMLHSGDLQFSFSGLKTAVRYQLERETGERNLPDLCASFREAVVDVLVGKAIRAAQAEGVSRIAVSGGVCANRRLQEKMGIAAGRAGIEVSFAAPHLRTDNAGMIAYVAALAAARGGRSSLDQDVCPSLARDPDFFIRSEIKALQPSFRDA